MHFTSKRCILWKIALIFNKTDVMNHDCGVQGLIVLRSHQEKFE
jgi:hypothetical protein